MKDNLNKDTVTEPVQNQEEKTFTQSELDEIIKERLGRERVKYSDYETLKEKASKFDEVEEKNKTELEKAIEKANELQSKLDAFEKENEIRSIREKVASKTGLPTKLLLGSTEEEMLSHANDILELTKTKYPSVKDAGETNSPQMSKTDILAIKDEKARLKAIEEHIELFK